MRGAQLSAVNTYTLALHASIYSAEVDLFIARTDTRRTDSGQSYSTQLKAGNIVVDVRVA